MIKEKRNLMIREAGKYEAINIIQYEDNDLYLLQDFYKYFMESHKIIRQLGGRGIILPTEFVEALVAYKMNYWKIDDIHYRFDCYDPNAQFEKKRIEIKYTTSRMDMSSIFGEITWDRLNFVKLYAESPKDCYFEMYDIDFDMMYQYLERFKGKFEGFNYTRQRISIVREFIEKGIYNNKTEFSLF